MNFPIKYVYLVSAPHSGSTLFACLLGGHPEISTVGEFGANISLDKYKCSCGEICKNCSFWIEWRERVKSEGLDFDIGNLNLGVKHNVGIMYDLFFYLFPTKLLNFARDVFFKKILFYYFSQTEAIIDKSIKLVRILCQIEGTSCFLDTTKNPLQIRFLSAHPLIDLKVISLVRDGRAVMNSLIRKEKYTEMQAIQNWLWSNRNMERVLKYYVDSNRVFRLRLEDFLEQPYYFLRSIFHFIGVDPDANLDFEPKRRHIIGNYMRYTFNGEIRPPDMSWKTQLTPAQVALFNRKAGWMNKKYGYK